MQSSVSSNDIADVHRKCVKSFTGYESEDVKQFIDQINAVKSIYKLNNDQVLKLIIEKIEGRALEWLQENPTMMTQGLDHFLRGLTDQFSKKAPKGPSKKPVAKKTEGITSKLDKIKLETPPSYETVIQEKKKIMSGKNDKPKADKPVKGTDEKEKNLNKGAKPKKQNEKSEHEGHKCASKPKKDVQSQEKTTNDLKCSYCKADGHFIKDCEKVPPCENCKKRGHKTKDCHQAKENSSQKKIRGPKEVQKIEININSTDLGFCKDCMAIGHDTAACPRK
uniref:CSON008892 protein n=1 Tax=Culicoides sonorensis TaxID=179676 RepID=A0A336MX57_CULSO